MTYLEMYKFRMFTQMFAGLHEKTLLFLSNFSQDWVWLTNFS